MTFASGFGEVDYRLNLTGLELEGRYQILSVLGRGGFSLVYLAIDERSFGRRVVVKVPRQELLNEEGFRDSFTQELRNLIKLEHPHIVKVLDVGEFRGLPYGVFQYLAAGSLLHKFAANDGNMSLVQILEWLPQITRALDFIHERNFVHGDIKPENILFDGTGNVVLSDFGIARALSAMGNKVKMGSTISSPQYVPPDAIDPKNIGPSYDQYALAVVVYQMLSGKFTHGWDTPAELLFRKLTEMPRPLTEVAPNIPQKASQIIMRALSSDPFERYASCQEFSDLLVQAIDYQPTRRLVLPQEENTTVERATGLYLLTQFPDPPKPPPKRGWAPTVALFSGGTITGLLGALLLAWMAGIFKEPATDVGSQLSATPLDSQPPPVISSPQETPARPLSPTHLPAPSASPSPTPSPPPTASSTPAAATPSPSLSPAASPLASPGPAADPWKLGGSASAVEGGFSLEPGATLASAQVYEIEHAFLLKATLLKPKSVFGLTALDGSVRLEFNETGGMLTVGRERLPFSDAWPDTAAHQITLILRKESVAAFLDKTKLGEIEGVPPSPKGIVGAFCDQGGVTLKSLLVRSRK